MRALFLAAVAIVLSACTQGEGPVVDETREAGPITRIEAGAGIHVAVTIGPAGPLVVHAQANIAESVRTDVRDGTLRVEAIDDFTTDEPVVIDVVTLSLESITLSGGAELTVRNFEADALAIDLSGGSRLTASGSIDSLTLVAKGGSVASLAELETADAAVTLDGGTTVELRASGSVTGTASGGASLTVAGGATVAVEASGGSSVNERQ